MPLSDEMILSQKSNAVMAYLLVRLLRDANLVNDPSLIRLVQESRRAGDHLSNGGFHDNAPHWLSLFVNELLTPPPGGAGSGSSGSEKARAATPAWLSVIEGGVKSCAV